MHGDCNQVMLRRAGNQGRKKKGEVAVIANMGQSDLDFEYAWWHIVRG